MAHEHTHDHGYEHENKFEVKLKGKKEIAQGTMAFHFERPEGFNFKAGQHVEITLINPPETDAEGNKRTFSLVNSPLEDDLIIATRIRGTAFKRVLKNIEVGTPVSLEGPFGSFTLHNDTARPAVFLMGGIGITPVMSIIKDATERKLSHRLFLFYSNRRPEDAAFFKELMELAEKNRNFIYVPTMSEMEKSSEAWSGMIGFIDKAMIEKYVKDIRSAIYYLSGPPGMVAVMRKILAVIGISDDNIKTEEFAGY